MSVPSSPLQILLVEDEAYFRLFVSKVLGLSLPCTVVEAKNGQEAVALCQTSEPDLILLDIYMPVMDGLEALPLIRALKPTTPIVMLTSVSEEAVVEKCVTLGASHLIRKDVNALELKTEIQKMLQMFFPVQTKDHEQHLKSTPA
jgi:CheY-like chemotaxis protein